ncbi:uncharacterized protein LOC125230283 [Leguminivora glycinivorella]|uniref:uncharacterized protein LOC125230283 n=1 Tax=Leguminivora glycinivorella TaxID=1035111 RepID=UPI00200CF6FB|nr:uncharacterized protein LOC125230283 [Leguminivora glycinivorella]
MENNKKVSCDKMQYITEKDIKLIVAKYGYESEDTVIEKYDVHYASDKLIGFVSDYLKLQISVSSNGTRKLLSFFVKAISKMNDAKANMAKDLGAIEKEIMFYDVIKRNLAVPGLKPWSPHFVTYLQDAVVFEDLSALQYEMRSRFEKFDKRHTLKALQTLARFHAGSIVFEEVKSKELQRPYTVNEQYKDTLGRSGYIESDPWFIQCRTTGLEAVRTFSKYRLNVDYMKIIERRWDAVFNSAMLLGDPSSEHRNVICHRDLWNNNILFHYKKLQNNSVVPDDCVFVDFVVARYMPPAGDVMQLLHCNLNPRFRKDNLHTFLNYYYDELKVILKSNDIDILNIMSREKFITSAKEQNLWGLVTHACLVEIFWMDDDMTTNAFTESAQFHKIMYRDKATYVINIMKNNEDYKNILLEVFEEFIEDYLLNQN